MAYRCLFGAALRLEAITPATHATMHTADAAAAPPMTAALGSRESGGTGARGAGGSGGGGRGEGDGGDGGGGLRAGGGRGDGGGGATSSEAPAACVSPDVCNALRSDPDRDADESLEIGVPDAGPATLNAMITPDAWSSLLVETELVTSVMATELEGTPTTVPIATLKSSCSRAPKESTLRARESSGFRVTPKSRHANEKPRTCILRV